MSDSATVTVSRSITAAPGVVAPGRLGELTQYLPFELVDDVLRQTKTVERRLRSLPSRVGVYFVLAMVMFPRLGYARVRQKLTAGLVGLVVPSPSESRGQRAPDRQTSSNASRETSHGPNARRSKGSLARPPYSSPRCCRSYRSIGP